MLKHKALVEEMLARPGVRAALEEQAPEYALLDEQLRARRKSGMPQPLVAERGDQGPDRGQG